MRIVVVDNQDISAFPPVLNLIKCLLEKGHYVTAIMEDSYGVLQNINSDRLKICLIGVQYNTNIVNQVFAYRRKRKILRTLVRNNMKDSDVLWTASDTTVRELGDDLFEYKHVMQLMELIEYVPRIPKCNWIKCDISKYARAAKAVVVPEVNRAYIQRTWWDLDRLPYVLPNKPYYVPYDETPKDLISIVEEMKNEKRVKVLYQGVFLEDRRLEEFAQAIDDNCEDYCFYIMGRENDYSKDIKNKYKNIKYIPFIPSPNHMYITREADIGVLPYTAKKLRHYSKLNALYCAPNKIFEYAAYGLPMIGSDVLGIKYSLENNDIGVTCELSEDNINKALQHIRDNYERMSRECKKFFDSVDLGMLIDEIIDSI